MQFNGTPVTNALLSDAIEMPQVPEVFRSFMMALLDVASDGKDKYKPAAQLRQLQRLFFKDDRVWHDQNSDEAKLEATKAYLKRHGAEPAQAKPQSNVDDDDEVRIKPLTTYLQDCYSCRLATGFRRGSSD